MRIFKPDTLVGKAEKLCGPNEKGMSRVVTREELIQADLPLGNGSPGWLRPDGSSSLAAKYNVIRSPEKGTIISIQLSGYKEEDNTQRSTTPLGKRKEAKYTVCELLGTNNPEVDHCDGHDCTDKLGYQFLGKAANCAKRQHCKECRETGNRFDARNIGYDEGWKLGDQHYNEKIGCRGCFWANVKLWKQQKNLNRGDNAEWII